MRTQSRVWLRLARLEAERREVARLNLGQRIAADLDVPVDELLAEARAIALRYRAAGARTLAAQCALLAADLDLTADDVYAEVLALRERLG